MTENCKLRIKNLTKLYKNKEGRKDGVENIDLDIAEGKLVTMLGPSGCGKTTILRCVGGFEEPDSGEIILDGQNIEKLPPNKRPTAMVFQSYNLWPHMKVFDNCAFGLKLRKMPKQQIEEEVHKALKLVQIEDMVNKFPGQLSGGQQQRVAIARALVLRPSLLLLDEPFSALDAKIRAEMREEVKKIQQELKITILFVTHDQEEAMAISDSIIVMNKAVFEQIGSPDEIYDNPKTKYVANFIGIMNFIEEGGGKVIAIRPEDLVVSKEKSDFLNGKIRTKMIMGHFTEVNIDTDKGVMKAFLKRENEHLYNVGDEVGLSKGKHMKFDA